MTLAATAQGLGSVWGCYFDPAILKAGLNLQVKAKGFFKLKMESGKWKI